MKFVFVSLLCLTLFVGFGADGKERYSEWGGGDAKYDALVERLKELIDSAEQARTADLRLLQDLHDAIAEHGASQTAAETERVPETAPELPPQILVRDGFRDGNFTRDPAWTVAEGRFNVDSGLGLRCVIVKASAPAETSSKEKRNKLVVDVLSSLLGNKDKEESAHAEASQPERAKIFIQTPISNFFRVVFEIVSREKFGRFSLDLFQGRLRGAGYRLSYTPGATPAMELQRFGASGVRNLATLNQTLNLEDNFRRRIEISRCAGGDMTVSVDGGQILATNDQSFRDAFSGITIANDGGDYSLREITVYGSR